MYVPASHSSAAFVLQILWRELVECQLCRLGCVALLFNVRSGYSRHTRLISRLKWAAAIFGSAALA